MRGIIIENISNLYRVKIIEKNGDAKGKIYEANARGRFKKDDITPVVGDFVECELVKEDKEKDRVSIDKILNRKVYIKRPKLANINKIVLVVSIKHPKPDLLMLDKQLAFVEFLGIEPLIVLNKIDKEDKKAENREEILKINKPVVKISAVTKEGIEDLYNEIIKMFNINKIEATNETVITNVRHKNQIDKAVKSIKEAINVAKERQTEDILAIYIKQTLEDLGEITGDNVSEDIINEIFSKFCLGK